MDYKKLIKSRKARVRILQAFNMVPDKMMVKIQYRIKTGHKLNLRNPKRFTEKLQWYKLNYRDPLMAQCSDKYEVRKYVEKCELGNILNDLYGVYNSPDEIDFDMLPESFVLKDTLGGGGNAVILVQDKSKMDEKAVRKQMLEWVNEPVNKKHPGREWVYDGRKHRIVAEKMLMSKEDQDLPDYKLYCFHGRCEYFYIRIGYAKNHAKGSLVFMDRDLKYLKGVGVDYCDIGNECLHTEEKILKQMIEMAEKLSKRFPHVRVDFYYNNGKIYFGEMTFFNASGYMTFEPDQFDYKMGEMFDLGNMGGAKDQENV